MNSNKTNLPGPSTVVIIVTYNRKHLLLECINALLAQTHPIDHILIINNASTDGTPQTLRENGYLDKPLIELITLPQNVGGAGGFNYGLKHAFEAGFMWFWLMDDDTIAAPDALQQLLEARDSFPADCRPNLLAGKAIWTDGSLHPMNIPRLDTSNPEQTVLATECRTAPIRYTTFVALLLHRSLVKQYGLPLADYFIWADDIEYTARILRTEFGILVPASIVTHKTRKKYTHRTESGSRYYYHIRNNLWTLRHSNAWNRKDKLKQLSYVLREIPAYLAQSRFKWQNIRLVLVGFKDGLLKKPRRH